MSQDSETMKAAFKMAGEIPIPLPTGESPIANDSNDKLWDH